MLFNKTYKAEKEKEYLDLSLSELIEKYNGKNYIRITFKKDGDVDVWISEPLKNQEEEQ